ncbi:MAG: AI-2E family transporter [Elusimicrobia bacterium]|nr:AI-2E family transporter [Elusimicrobiota bacterium]
MSGREGASDRPVQFNRQRLIQYFFFGVFLLLIYQAVLMLSPFFVAILGSAILAMIAYPLHARISKKLPRYPSVAAGITTSLAALTIVLPLLLFGWVFLKEAPKVYPAAKTWMDNLEQLRSDPSNFKVPDQIKATWEGVSSFMRFWKIDIEDIFLKNLDELSENMSHFATLLIRNMAFVGFNLIVLVFTLFFFLRDGPHIIRRIVDLVPMAADHKRVILERIQDTLFAVIRGVLVVALVQGFLTGVGFAMFGVPFPVLLGTLATMLSPIPILGAAGVWLPVAVCLALSGSVMQAVYVSLWCMVIVHTIDNILRPLLIGTHAKIPILLLFFGLLGGMKVYGFLGVLLGPVVIALLLAFISIYQEEYRWLLQRRETASE